tara:strand:- start:6354 stop:6764 length:411 start_codon:yes stop_codon:yes gene_type:complete
LKKYLEREKLMKENNNWKLLFRGNNLIDIELKRKILEKKNIRCNLLNKKDSSFHPISFVGETIELYVLKKDFQQAAELIKSTIKQKSFATKHKKRKLLNTVSGIILFSLGLVGCLIGEILIGSVMFVFGVILILNY